MQIPQQLILLVLAQPHRIFIVTLLSNATHIISNVVFILNEVQDLVELVLIR